MKCFSTPIVDQIYSALSLIENLNGRKFSILQHGQNVIFLPLFDENDVLQEMMKKLPKKQLTQQNHPDNFPNIYVCLHNIFSEISNYINRSTFPKQEHRNASLNH